MDASHFKHYSIGTVVNSLVIILAFKICFNMLGLDFTTSRLICLVACIPIHLIWEIRQKKKGGKNTTKEAFIDGFYGWVSSIPLVYLLPLALIN